MVDGDGDGDGVSGLCDGILGFWWLSYCFFFLCFFFLWFSCFLVFVVFCCLFSGCFGWLFCRFSGRFRVGFWVGFRMALSALVSTPGCSGSCRVIAIQISFRSVQELAFSCSIPREERRHECPRCSFLGLDSIQVSPRDYVVRRFDRRLR